MQESEQATTANGLVRELFRPLSPLANRFGLAWGTAFLFLWLDYFNFRLLPEWLLLLILFCVTLASFRWRMLLLSCDTLVDRAACTLCMLPTWFLSVTVTSWAGWISFSVTLGQLGLGLVFLLGLSWCVWLVDRASKMLLAKRQLTSLQGGSTAGPLISMNSSLGQATTQTSNPLDVEAWFYGSKRRKLNQSATAMGVYTILFTLLLLLITQLTGCNEIYEMPDGGGEPQLKQQVVKIQKVIRKKIILNPLSSVLFNPPPIEEIKLQLQELTKHVYEVGQGERKNAGFEGGTRRGLVRFIRLSYAGGDWEQDLDRNSDLNMLLWYAANTGHKTAKKPEVRSISQLNRFPVSKSPPMVYMTGQGNIRLSGNEIETLQEYLTEKHGMLFADNGGSSGWHNQFFSLMQKILPKVKPQPVPLDHPVHNGVPFLPVVAPHGGRVAWGWVIDGRLAVYYHPGDVGDAWADGHAGVPRHVWESGYRLGGNVMLYAHSEYSRWLTAKNQSE